MKFSIPILLICMFLTSACSSIKPKTFDAHKTAQINKTSNDSTEYKLIVMDPEYDYFLQTQPPENFYTYNYYKSWNIQYVTEWNIRHSNPLKYGDFYETYINFDPDINYGLDLNYRLYNYFLFIKKQYHIILINRKP